MKRTLSFALILCMVFSLFSGITAFAEEPTPINGEYLLYFDEPKVGATLDSSVTLPAGAPFTATVYWDVYTAEHEYITATGTVAEKAYRATVELSPKSGFRFGDITVFLNDFAANIMGMGEDVLTMEEYYDLRKEITEIKVNNVKNAEFGQAVPTAIPTVAADAPYTVVDYKWFVSGEGDPFTGSTFGKNNYYYTITLAPKAGYSFSQDRDVYVNGQYRHDTYLGPFDTLMIEDYFYFKDTIPEVNLSGVPDAVLGGTANGGTITVPAGAPYTASYYWVDENYEPLVGTFEDGKKYIRRIEVTAAENYEFPPDKIILNGKEIAYEDVNWDSSALWIETTFSFKKVIKKVEVTDTKLTVGTTYSMSGATVPEGAHYYHTGSHVTNAEHEFLMFPVTIENGKAYYYQNNLYPEEGYEFAEDLQVYLNGQLIKANDFGRTYLNLVYRYSYLKPISKVDLPAFPAAKIGEKAVFGDIAAPAGALYDITGRWYYDDNYSSREFIGTFARKGVYQYHLNVYPHEGYEFTNDVEINIGGKKYAGYTEAYNEHIMLSRYSTIGYNMINEINISAEKPTIGEEYDYSSIKVDDTGYVLEYACWYTNDKDEFNYDNYTDEFVENNYYWLEIGVLANSGKRFPHDVTVRINGRPVTPVAMENWGAPYIYFAVPFGKLTKEVPLKDSTTVFNDLKKGQWYQEYTNYVYTKGLMEGVGNGKFAPATTMTRAMFVTVLARMAGIDTKANNVQAGFNDVKSGQWYAAAVKWASESKIVNGVGDGKFDPNAQIKRQDICVMLLRYANVLDVKLQKDAAKAAFADDNKIQSYAKDAVYTCQQAAIVNGKPGNQFDPRGFATRAEVSKMLSIFHQDYIA